MIEAFKGRLKGFMHMQKKAIFAGFIATATTALAACAPLSPYPAMGPGDNQYGYPPSPVIAPNSQPAYGGPTNTGPAYGEAQSYETLQSHSFPLCPSPNPNFCARDQAYYNQDLNIVFRGSTKDIEILKPDTGKWFPGDLDFRQPNNFAATRKPLDFFQLNNQNKLNNVINNMPPEAARAAQDRFNYEQYRQHGGQPGYNQPNYRTQPGYVPQ